LVRLVFISHANAAVNDRHAFFPLEVNSQTNAIQLSKTVNQKIALNGCFFVLCLKLFCAINAPGQPPMRAKRCSVLSLVRQPPSLYSAYRGVMGRDAGASRRPEGVSLTAGLGGSFTLKTNQWTKAIYLLFVIGMANFDALRQRLCDC